MPERSMGGGNSNSGYGTRTGTTTRQAATTKSSSSSGGNSGGKSTFGGANPTAKQTNRTYATGPTSQKERGMMLTGAKSPTMNKGYFSRTPPATGVRLIRAYDDPVSNSLVNLAGRAFRDPFTSGQARPRQMNAADLNIQKDQSRLPQTRITQNVSDGPKYSPNATGSYFSGPNATGSYFAPSQAPSSQPLRGISTVGRNMQQSPMQGQGAPGFSRGQNYGANKQISGSGLADRYNAFALGNTQRPISSVAGNPGLVDPNKPPGDYSYPRKMSKSGEQIAKIGGGLLGGLAGGIGGILGGATAGNSLANGYNRLINMPYSGGGDNFAGPEYGMGSSGDDPYLAALSGNRAGKKKPPVQNSGVVNPLDTPLNAPRQKAQYPKYYSDWWGGMPSGEY